MRVLVIAHDLALPMHGGIWTYLQGLLPGLSRRGIEVIGLGPRSPDLPQIAQALGFPVLPFAASPGHYLIRVPEAVLEVRRLIRRYRPDAIIAEPWYPGGLGAVWGSGRVPVHVMVFGLDLLSVQRPDMRWLMGRCLKGADGIVACSLYSAGLAVAFGARRDRVYEVTPGVSGEAFLGANRERGRIRYGLGQKPVVSTVSRLVARKGFDTVIKCLPRVRERFPDVLYLVGGEGPYRDELMALTRSLGLEDSVQFVGPVPNSELPDFYAASDVFAMVSRIESGFDVEGFGIVFLEAGACGIPVIGGLSGGVVEAVKDGETGYLVDPTDPEAVAAALVRILSNPEESRRMGGNGRLWAAENTWDRAVDKLLPRLAGSSCDAASS